jgi:hypothetical protein
MTDRLARDRLAEGLRQFAAGRSWSEDFERHCVLSGMKSPDPGGHLPRQFEGFPGVSGCPLPQVPGMLRPVGTLRSRASRASLKHGSFAQLIRAPRSNPDRIDALSRPWGGSANLLDDNARVMPDAEHSEDEERFVLLGLSMSSIASPCAAANDGLLTVRCSGCRSPAEPFRQPRQRLYRASPGISPDSPALPLTPCRKKARP